MNTLLLFFALPVATIILAIVLEKILRNPILTAATFFAIYLIVAFAAFDEEFLVFVIIYTILAFIAAVIAEFFYRRCEEQHNEHCRWLCRNRQTNNNTNENVITLSNQDIARIANQLANIQNNNNSNNDSNNNNCGCSNDVVTANITNNTTGGRTSWCCYRRR